MATLGLGVIGCGLIGRRRAQVAARAAGARCVIVADVAPGAAATLAAEVGAEAAEDWRAVLAHPAVDVIAIATPNGYLAEYATAALAAGKHVLVEKPMGRSLAEAEQMRNAAVAAGRLLKIGFNHRYHPAIAQARRLVVEGAIGPVINARCRYGHGGRPGYEAEWRGDRTLSGGGELTDQGVHVVDLFHWFLGVPQTAVCIVQTAVWPLGTLEDNAFGLFRFGGDVVASFHTSWTQWKNLFSFEVFGARGAVLVEGLGRSYGTETLTVVRRRPEGGVPDTETQAFPGEDSSWELEWQDFASAIATGRPMLGTADDGVTAMLMLDALYRSAQANVPVPLGGGED